MSSLDVSDCGGEVVSRGMGETHWQSMLVVVVGRIISEEKDQSERNFVRKGQPVVAVTLNQQDSLRRALRTIYHHFKTC